MRVRQYSLSHARLASPGGNVLARQARSQRCSVDGCEERVTARGFCGMHYQRHAAGKPMDSPFLTEREEQGTM